MSAPRGDRAKVTLFVAVPPSVAFAVFTEDIDRWWKRGVKFRPSGKSVGKLVFEPGVNGRLFETYRLGESERCIEVGRIVTWEPPGRLLFEWRNTNFAPHEKTEVEVRFDVAPGGTQVVLEHRGWSSLPLGHPARHGLEGAAFQGMIGMWWTDLLGAFRERAQEAQ